MKEWSEQFTITVTHDVCGGEAEASLSSDITDEFWVEATCRACGVTESFRELQ